MLQDREILDFLLPHSSDPCLILTPTTSFLVPGAVWTHSVIELVASIEVVSKASLYTYREPWSTCRKVRLCHAEVITKCWHRQTDTCWHHHSLVYQQYCTNSWVTMSSSLLHVSVVLFAALVVSCTSSPTNNHDHHQHSHCGNSLYITVITASIQCFFINFLHIVQH